MATTRDILEGRLVIAHNGLLEAEVSHESHGHPPLTDPGTEFWMKWDEWNMGLMETNQENQLKQFERSLKPGLLWFRENARSMALDVPPASFPEPPPENASYEEEQTYLVNGFETALTIALPEQSDPVLVKQRLVQTTLDRYSVLYQRLKLGNDPTTIRLLEILPGSSGDSPVETRLFNTSLESSGLSYEALSYAWGAVANPRYLRSIRVNGLVQRVTPNLLGALSSLRLLDRSRALWVDSICINQGDHKERARQIMLMAQIFAKAERTVVYIGPSTTASTAFFRFLNLPLCERSVCEDCGVDRSLVLPLHHPLQACKMAGLEEDEVLDGFIDICQREWWDRVWILQEFVLSKQDPMFYCGRNAVPNQLLARNFCKVYDWAFHRKLHPVRLDACSHFACNDSDLATVENHGLKGGSAGANEGSVIPRSPHNQEGDKPAGRTDCVQTDGEGHGNANEESDTAFLKPIEVPQQNQRGCEWSSWGVSAWKASCVLQRRSVCRPWHAPDYIYRTLNAHCSDPHDIVYGVRELMEPAFREIFKPDYTVSIPKLYTKLSAYMLLFHCWSDMFAYYPHRLSPGSSGLQPARYTPSWVPDFTRPAEIKEGEKRPHKNETDVTDNSGRPYIINQVLFMGGLLLDEIVHVFPLPRNDPFKVLQQLWYIERLYGRPGYELLHSNSPGDSDSGNSFDSFVQKTKGVSVYPSIAWATRFSEGLPHDISIVHIIFKTANLKGLSVAIDKVLDMRTVCLEQQLEREGKKFGRGASREERDEYWRRDEEISGRLSALMKFVLGDKWLDFIGICTFDFESLRAQVQHRLVPISPWKPSRLPGRRVVDQCEVDLCDPPFTSAVMQRPVRYSSLLRAIVKDVKSGAELRMREEAVMLLAEVVHDATIKVVGGQNEVSYFRPGSQKGDGDAGKENSNVVHHSDRDANDIIYDGKDEIDERVQTIINDFVMDPLPIDVTIGDYPDTPLVAFRALQEEIQTVNRIDNYLEQPEKTSDVNNIVEEGEGEDHVVSKSSESTSHFDEVVGNKNADSVTKLHSSGTLGGRISEPGDGTVVEDEASSEERPLGTLQRGKDGMHGEVEVSSRHNTPVRSISMMSQESSSTSEETPSGSMSQWRRIEKRALNDVHILLTGVVDFLAGREFFLTETRLLGLTYPGTQGVRDGDDLLLLEGMSFPLVARLEPSKELGNPKKRRRDMPTKGMRREIVGTAIVRDIDANGGKLDEAQIPAGLEPLSGFTPGFFRFK